MRAPLPHGHGSETLALVYCWSCDCFNSFDVCTRCCLPVPDCRDPSAERQGSRSGRSVRGHGFPDGFRSAWFGDAAFEGHDGFGDPFYADVDHFVDHRDEEPGVGYRHSTAETSDEDFGAGDTGSDPVRAGGTEEVESPEFAVVAELADALP